jgi:hypothetical protein
MSYIYELLGIADDVGGSPINIGDPDKKFNTIEEAEEYAFLNGAEEALEVYVIELDPYTFQRPLDPYKTGYFTPAIKIK